VRLARRGRSTVVRCAYAVAVFLALYASYQSRFPEHRLLDEPFASPASVSPGDLARLAERFVSAILAIQSLAILVLTPAYLAGAVVEEKERGTLDLLFTTHLRDREIVLGKLAGRLVHLAGILAAGLPLLTLVQLWGGVDIYALLAAFLVTALNLLA